MTCKTENCNREVVYKTLQLCRSCYCYHIQRHRVYTTVCKTEGCGRPIQNVKHQLCRRCYLYWRATENPEANQCSIENCEKPAVCKGYCTKHYKKLLRHGDPLTPEGRARPRGIRALKGESLTSHGYKRIRLFNEQGKAYWILEHRHVMQESLGRSLLPDEEVHHKNGQKQDNRRENLELWIKPHANGIKVEDAISWAKEILARYEALDISGDKCLASSP